MFPVKRISPEEAKKLMQEGYTYVDVRTEREFSVRHPTGALNVPLDQIGPNGLVRNPEFLPVMQRLFAEDAKIIVGCASGVRSLRAAEILALAGFADVIDQRAGMEGARSPFGALAEQGWAAAGLPVTQGPDSGSFAVIKARP
jgi:rhodanese-related sulfurtransferase